MSTRSESPQLSCTCEVDRLRSHSAVYVIAPSRGGGWAAWAEAFARLIDRLATQPVHCVVITQEPNQRYVQLMVGHGHAHLEVSSNHYLMGDFRLGPDEERMLESLRFEPPDTVDESLMPLNWWRDDDHADPETIAGLVLTLLTALTGFDERYPVSVDVFGADHPCAACFWEAE